MSKKPRIFGTCSAGCLWETVHKDDFLKSASIVDLHNNGETQYVDVTNKYRIGSEAESQAISTLEATLPSAANGIAAAAVGTKVYLFGGSYTSGALNTINVFDTANNSITTLTTTLPAYTTRMAAAAVGTKIYLFGGLASGLSPLNTIIVFDTTNNSITTLTTTLPTAADNIAAVAVGTKIYLLGGLAGTSLENYSSLNTINVFDTENNSITTLTATLPTAAVVSAAAVGTKIFVFRASVTDVFDTANNSITTLTTAIPTTNSASAAAVGTRIYLFGGYDESSVNTINVFDTKDNSVTTLTTTLPTAADTIAAVAVGTKTYLFGGKNSINLNTINVFNGDNIKCAVSLTYGIGSDNSEYQFDLDTTYYDAIKKLFTFEIVSATVNFWKTALTVVYDVTDGAAQYKRYTVRIPGKGLSIENSKIKVSGATSLYAYNQDAEILEAGDSVFIRYSANADGTDYTETWTSGQNYIGVASGKTEPADKTGYTWSKFCSSEDGEIEDLKTQTAELAEQKIDKTTIAKVLHGTDENGATVCIPYRDTGTYGEKAIAMWDENGQLYTEAYPDSETSLSNKGYVDECISGMESYISYVQSDLENEISGIKSVLEKTIVRVDVEDTYSSRSTAGGMNIENETQTVVNKITGSTSTTKNIVDLSMEQTTVNGVTVTCDNNRYTFSGNTSQSMYDIAVKTVTLPSSWGGKTITLSQSKYFGSASAYGSSYLKITKSSDGSVVGRSAENPVTVTLIVGETYSISVCCGSKYMNGESNNFMVNEGSAALPYSDYFAGVKPAKFKGIVSQSQLIDITGTDRTIGEISCKFDEKAGSITFTGGTNTLSVDIGITIAELYLTPGNYTLYCPNKRANNIGFYLASSVNTNYTTRGLPYNSNAKYYTYTATKAAKVFFFAVIKKSANITESGYVETPMFVSGNWSNKLTFMPFKKDDTFSIDTAISLGKWDSIDVAGKKLTVQTANVNFATAVESDVMSDSNRPYFLLTSSDAIGTEFSDSDLVTNIQTTDSYQTIAPDENAYIGWDMVSRCLVLLIPTSYTDVSSWLADNPDVYATYKQAEPTETTVDIPNAYTAWRSGQETIDNATTDYEQNAPVTVNQTYLKTIM